MPLIVHRATRPEALAVRLAELLAVPPSDPFAIDRIAVHSGGLEQWLAMQIAQHNGICSAVSFPHPTDLVAQLAAAAVGDDPDSLRSWTSGRLLWALLAELRPLLAPPVMRPVEDYLAAEGPTERTLRMVTLCQRLARVFQAYGTHRTELVHAWQVPRDDEPWEAPLWRAVEARLGANHMTGWADRLGDAPTLPDGLGRIVLFGVSTLPPLLLQVADRLAYDHDLHVFLLHPSPRHWARGGTPSHPLLDSMGALVRDAQGAVAACDNVQHDVIDQEPTPRDSLLHALQADLFDDALRPYAAEASDPSLQVHVCASPLRQVQALRDALLDLLTAQPDLQLRDVVVMSPDVETYAPLVQAVFGDGARSWADAGAHPAGLPQLPFRLADRGARAENVAAEALLRLLDLADARLDAPAVAELLSLPPVYERFGIASDQLLAARQLLVEGGVRWGRDGAHRALHELPDDERFTWRFALDRLLVGQALAAPGTSELYGLAFDGGAHGKDERAVLGGLVDFAETLLAETAGLAGDRSPSAWFARLATALDRLLDDRSERSWQKAQVLDALAELSDHADEAGIHDEVDLRTVRALLGERFSLREPGQGFLAGSVTVCELVPLRSVPFQVVCLLGIDDGVFPRVAARPGYDRMALDRRPGDRDARADDRALFLEAVLSARRALLVTCTGRSERTGRDLPMAVPVAELVEAATAMGAEAVVRHHPLQPWAPEPYVDGSAYDRRMAAAAEAWRRGRHHATPAVRRFAEALPGSVEVPEEMTLDQLATFWRHPPTQLVRLRLGLKLWEDDTELVGALPHELDALEHWQLTDTLLAAGRAGESLEPDGPVARRLLRGAQLPLGTPGRVLLAAASEQVADFLATVGPLLEGPQRPIDIDVQAGLRLSGRVDGLTASGHVLLHAGKVHPRHQLAAWIRHLALHASGWSGRTFVMGARHSMSFGPIDRSGALDALHTLTDAVALALSVPCLFWADASHDAWMGHSQEEDETQKPWKAFSAARSAFDRRRDVEKLVDGWVLGETMPFHPEVEVGALVPDARPPLEVAEQVWAPAIAVRRPEGQP